MFDFLNENSRHYMINIFLAFFVTLLWSTSFVIIKIGLKTITPILFSGFRYLLASIILLLLVSINPTRIQEVKSLKRKEIVLLILYGIVFITFTQGLQYLSLNLLPAITVSQLLTLTPVIVLLLSNFLLEEIPSKFDIIFLFFALIGVFLFYYPFTIPFSELLGLLFLVFCLFSNALATILGRHINSSMHKAALTITSISMFFGGVLLTILGLLLEPFVISITEIFYIIILAVFNTALAFTLWNKSMKTLRALDISLINNTMLPQITILSIIFLQESLTFVELIALIIIFFSVIFIQIHSISKQNSSTKKVKVSF